MKVIHMGVGGFGGHWSKVLAASDDVEVVALVDVSEAALAETCETFDYDPQICFPTLDAALAQIDADLLICVTPPKYHPEHVTAALHAGLHVICEKPMANSLDECVTMFQAARASERQFIVSQNYRYRPEMQTLAQLVRDGVIGTIGQIKLDFYKGWYFDEDNFRRTMPNPMIVDMSIHHFDLLRFVTGLEAETVRGEAWNPPWSDNTGDTSTALHFRLNNGARVVYNASWCAQGDFCDWNGNWLIEGDKGSLEYKNGEITLNKANGRYQAIETETIELQAMALTDQAYLLRRFIEATQKGNRAETDVADNLRSIGMVFASETAVASQQITPILTPELEALLAADKQTQMDVQELMTRYAAGERNFQGVDLSGVDLYEAQLEGIDLSQANLANANLSMANLSGSNLSHTNLADTNLSGTILKGANLSQANLTRADLSWANLSQANLTAADLSAAVMKMAILIGTRFRGTTMPDGTKR